MKLIRNLTAYRPPRKTAIAIGNFDGLHCGHVALLQTMQIYAQAQGLIPAVLTFEPHPRRFFAPDAPPFRLERVHDKLSRLRELGVELVAAPRFNRAFASLSAEQFLNDVLGEQLQAAAVFVGKDFGFGKGRSGNVDTLKRWGAMRDVAVEPIDPVTVEGADCSSSAVRVALAAGDMAQVRSLLGREYSVRGRVVKGEKRGHALGYPTANIVPPTSIKLPLYGIYAVRVRVGEQAHWHAGVASYGVRPTVTEHGAPWLEVHVFDFTGDLYGQRLEVAFVARLRSEEKFDSLEALAQQMSADALAARQLLKDHV